jgi:hypothetical protein
VADIEGAELVFIFAQVGDEGRGGVLPSIAGILESSDSFSDLTFEDKLVPVLLSLTLLVVPNPRHSVPFLPFAFSCSLLYLVSASPPRGHCDLAFLEELWYQCVSRSSCSNSVYLPLVLTLFLFVVSLDAPLQC